MHLVPNFIMAAILVLAWKYERIGGVLFILAGLFFTLFFNTYQMLINFLIISFPLFLIGTLFLVHYKYKNSKG